jgi:thymidine kinase
VVNHKSSHKAIKLKKIEFGKTTFIVSLKKMLHLFVGPMYAGKTTKMIELSSRVESKIIVDYRIGPEPFLSTHDGVRVECFQTQTLAEVPVADNIFINEAQFFQGLKEFVLSRLNEKKTVYLFGLDGCSAQRKFGEILDLIPYCDTVTKLTSTCSCGKSAIFSKRLSSAEGQYLPDGEFSPKCRDCF